jgi:serine protease Do
LALLVGGIAGALTSGFRSGFAGKPAFTVQAASSDDVRIHETFAPIVRAVAPAIVNISTSKTVKAPDTSSEPFLQDPFFKRFFGDQFPELFRAPRERRARSLGSGVIVSQDGYILTNNHVVEDAHDIHISLNDGKEFTGRVIGTDPKTDLAVVKIDQTGLQTITLGDSKEVQAGDIALAFGNPFGLGGTVTMGVVSAIGRGGLGIEEIEDFIQTDAAVNPGNSGGALVNSRGQLIGINTAILSPNGGNLGIGFAVPVNLARNVMEQISRTGKVTRGWLGVALQDVTGDMAAMFHLDKPRGALVADLDAQGPAAKAGIRSGDVILSIDDKPIADSRSLQLILGQMTPGNTVRFTILRDGRQQDVKVTLAEERVPESSAPQRERDSNERSDSETIGLTVQTLDAQTARRLGFAAGTQGVAVVNVEPGSVAEEARLRHGDVIVEVNRQPVRNQAEFESAMDRLGNATALLFVNSGGRKHYVTIRGAAGR